MPYVMISRAERILLLFGVGNTNKINKNKQKIHKNTKNWFDSCRALYSLDQSKKQA